MSTYGSAPKPKPPGDPKTRMPKRKNNNQNIDPFNEQNTEDAAGGGRYNPWGKGSKKNPTNSSQTTGP